MSFLVSSVIFTLSSLVYFGVALYTYVNEPEITNLGNLAASLFYVIGYVIYVVAEAKTRRIPLGDEEKQQLLNNQPIRQIQF